MQPHPLDGRALSVYRRLWPFTTHCFNMSRPVIGIIGNPYLIDEEYPVQSVGVSNIDAISDLTSNSSSRRRGIALSGLYAGGHALVVFLIGANDQHLVHALSATNRTSPSRLRCL